MKNLIAKANWHEETVPRVGVGGTGFFFIEFFWTFFLLLFYSRALILQILELSDGERIIRRRFQQCMYKPYFQTDFYLLYSVIVFWILIFIRLIFIFMLYFLREENISSEFLRMKTFRFNNTIYDSYIQILIYLGNCVFLLINY